MSSRTQLLANGSLNMCEFFLDRFYSGRRDKTSRSGIEGCKNFDCVADLVNTCRDLEQSPCTKSHRPYGAPCGIPLRILLALTVSGQIVHDATVPQSASS